jgi:hypothetical protein
MVSSRPDWATKQNPVSTTTTNKEQQQKKKKSLPVMEQLSSSLSLAFLSLCYCNCITIDGLPFCLTREDLVHDRHIINIS